MKEADNPGLPASIEKYEENYDFVNCVFVIAAATVVKTTAATMHIVFSYL